MSEKTLNLPISKYIDTRFRDYSLYVISHRGIPSFYDALTPVQRYILMNSPQSFVKTLTVVGRCIEDSYHHGNISLEKSISRLAKPFGSSLRFLDGYGFFGTEVSPDPAAARYTSVKLNPIVNDIIKQYKYLTTREEDGPYDPFWLDLPIGLTTTIVGIAVGYKTTILPRKLENIKRYLKGEIKTVRPHFTDFSGTIHKYGELEKAWIISSNIEIEGNKIKVRELPPILKYTAVLKRLDHLITRYESKIRLVNNSNTKANIDIVYLGKSKEEWKDIQKYIRKVFSIIVTENIVFVKDGQVLVYDTVEEYLDDYKWQILRLTYYNTLHERNFLREELTFSEAKKEFITFILRKKRSVAEVDIFLKPYEKSIIDRLERMTSKKFTSDELEATHKKISELKKELREKEKGLIKSEKEFKKVKDPTLSRGVGSKKMTGDLLDIEDVSEIDGICIWGGEDLYDEGEKDQENNG